MARLLGVLVLVGVASVLAEGQETNTATASASVHRFAQTVVDKTLSAHPETDEIGIAVQSDRSCTVVASTDKSDVGETCEADDRAPIRTGKPHVGKEGGEFDVSVPLHDKRGEAVGAVTVRFKKASGQTNDRMANAALAIAKEMAEQIASKAALLAR